LSSNFYIVAMQSRKNPQARNNAAIRAKEDFIRIFSAMKGGVVFIHTPQFYVLPALSDALSEQPALKHNFRRLVVETTTIGKNRSEQTEQMLQEMEVKAFRTLSRLLDSQFEVLALTQAQAAKYQKLGFEFPVVPILVSKTKNDGNLHQAVSCIGQPRSDKGVLMFLEAFVWLSKNKSIPAPFRFQAGSNRFRFPDLGDDMKKIFVIRENPSRPQYRQSMLASYPLVLAYLPEAYSDGRGSGMLYEALYNRIPVICSEADIFTSWLQNYGLADFIFSPYDHVALAKTVMNFFEHDNVEARFAPLFDAFAAENGTKKLFEVLMAGDAPQRGSA